MIRWVIKINGEMRHAVKPGKFDAIVHTATTLCGRRISVVERSGGTSLALEIDCAQCRNCIKLGKDYETTSPRW